MALSRSHTDSLRDLMQIAPAQVVQDGTATRTHSPLELVEAAERWEAHCSKQKLKGNPGAAIRSLRIVPCRAHRY